MGYPERSLDYEYEFPMQVMAKIGHLDYSCISKCSWYFLCSQSHYGWHLESFWHYYAYCVNRAYFISDHTGSPLLSYPDFEISDASWAGRPSQPLPDLLSGASRTRLGQKSDLQRRWQRESWLKHGKCLIASQCEEASSPTGVAGDPREHPDGENQVHP